jgi:O-antigen/teichoic acid export membrane protein
MHPGADYSIERLRANGMILMAGRVISSGLSILTFYIVATRLPVPTYALYVWLVALGQILRQCSYLGVNSIAGNYVPFVHSQFAGEVRYRFLMQLLISQVVVVSISLVAVAALAPQIVGLLGEYSWAEPLRWFTLVLLMEHLLEFVRNCIFMPLMRQGVYQITMMIQAFGMLTGLLVGLAVTAGAPTIYWAIAGHLCGGALALAHALAQFFHMARAPGVPDGRRDMPGWREMIRFGFDNFGHDLLSLSSGGQIMTVLGRQMLGLTELARFGFVQNLYQRVQRVVPGRFFFGLLRPTVVVRYRTELDFTELNRRIMLIFKLSFCVWAALAIFLATAGEQVLALLSSGKYVGGYGLLLGFLLVLALQDLKRVMVLMTNTLGVSSLLRRAGYAYLLAVPCAAVLVALGAGPYGLVIGIIVAEVGFELTVLCLLRNAGHAVAFDLPGQLRILAAAACATVIGGGVVHGLPEGPLYALAGGVLAVLVFALVLWRVRPFRPDERRAIERLANRKLGWL